MFKEFKKAIDFLDNKITTIGNDFKIRTIALERTVKDYGKEIDKLKLTNDELLRNIRQLTERIATLEEKIADLTEEKSEDEHTLSFDDAINMLFGFSDMPKKKGGETE